MPIHACCDGERSKHFAINTGKIPLSKSPNSVKLAKRYPAIRTILVAPGLPDPNKRGSILPVSLLSRMANDREPSK